MRHPGHDNRSTPGRSLCLGGLAAAVCVAAAASGCYQRTVSSRGLGSRGVDTHEPNLKTGEDRGAIDRVVDSIVGPPGERPR